MNDNSKETGGTRSRWVFTYVCIWIVLLLMAVWLLSLSRQDVESDEIILWETATAPEQAWSSELVARGKKVYSRYCARCHGEKGDGQGPDAAKLKSPARDFRPGIFKFRTTPASSFPTNLDLFRSITAGFPGYGMPSYVRLPVKDRWGLVYYVRKLVADGLEATLREGMKKAEEEFNREEALQLIAQRMRPGTPVTIPPEPPGTREGAVQRGRRLFSSPFYECSKCHGFYGKGDGIAGFNKKDDWGNPIIPRDFTAGRAARKSGWRPRDTVRIILIGIPGTPMPSFGYAVGHPQGIKDIWDIARFVQSLSKTTETENPAEKVERRGESPGRKRGPG